MIYSIQLLFNENNNLLLPDPFFIFLSGGAGVGKSFLIKMIVNFISRVLKFHGQKDEHSILVTASTGKAASNINGTTVHSAFKLPIRKPSAAEYRKPSDENLHKLKLQCQFLKVLVVDEISMVGGESFDDLDATLRLITEKNVPFGGVSILCVGDFFQLPPVMQRAIWEDPKAEKAGYRKFSGNCWKELFSLYELTEIVRQIGDPKFAEVLNRLREGAHTKEDVDFIKTLENKDTSIWPGEHVKLFITNYMTSKENMNSLQSLTSEKFKIVAVDSLGDKSLTKMSFSVPSEVSLSNTANLVKELNFCVGSRVMLTDNLNIEDHLINGSLGTVRYIQVPNRKYPLAGQIFVEFDDPAAGVTMKNIQLPGIFKNCVPISACTKPFTYKYGKKWINVERKQYPFVLAYALTVHKSQGSTLKYVSGDFSKSTGKFNTKGKEYLAPVEDGLFYTMLSRAVSSQFVSLKNFKEDVIKVNHSAKREMERMRHHAVFNWKHPLHSLSEEKVCLLNMRSWNKHISHFTSNNLHSSCSIFCFTETNCSIENRLRVENYLPQWKDIHLYSQHGLAICYNTNKVLLLEEIEVNCTLELLPLLFVIKEKHVLIVLIYRKPGPLGNFFTELHAELEKIFERIPSNCRKIVLRDFNFDQRLSSNEVKLMETCTAFTLHQRSKYSTHILGGILDLVLDSSSDKPVAWCPSPFSDHFNLYFE